MSGALQVSAVGLREQQRALNIIANNIANVNTPAFKRDDIRFAEIVMERTGPQLATPGLPGSDARNQYSGVQLTGMPMLFEQGALRRTEQSLDLAVDGAGFIEVLGPGAQTYLWRGGRLRVMGDGRLANEQGMVLAAAITIPEDATTLTIGRDGTVTAVVGEEIEPLELGQIELVRVISESDVDRIDGGLFRLADGAELRTGSAAEDGMGSLVQGSVEQSSVTFDDEMIQLLLVQRAFAANAQIVQAADQLLGIANNLKR
jgi:flagellar basal-body rod protein FlgG